MENAEGCVYSSVRDSNTSVPTSPCSAVMVGFHALRWISPCRPVLRYCEHLAIGHTQGQDGGQGRGGAVSTLPLSTHRPSTALVCPLKLRTRVGSHARGGLLWARRPRTSGDGECRPKTGFWRTRTGDTLPSCSWAGWARVVRYMEAAEAGREEWVARAGDPVWRAGERCRAPRETARRGCLGEAWGGGSEA